jgi:hypothetical protein
MIDPVVALRRLPSFAVLVCLAACRSLVDPDLPSNAEEFSPPPVYARWWAMTEACSRLSGDLSSVSWFVVPGANTVLLDGKPVQGYWSSAGNRIVIAGAGKLTGDIVRHEMLHALIQGRGHPRSKFLDDCGGVVLCTEACISDAGPAPAPDPAAIQIGPEPLEVQVDVEPAAPSRAVDDGFFALIVSVRNASTHPVVVLLPPAPIGGGPRSFSFDLAGQSFVTSGNEFALDPSVSVFAAGETKRHVFDFMIGSDLASRTLPPGTYTVRAGYGGNLASHAPIVIAP